MSRRNPTRPGVFSAGLEKPHFRGRSVKGKRLAVKAESARKRRVQRLSREHPSNRAAKDLAKKLGRCKPERRCLSGACPVCAQAAQELFVQLGRQLITMGKSQSMPAVRNPLQTVAITLVPDGLISKPGNMNDLQISLVHRRVTDRLAKAKVWSAAGVLEVGLVEHVKSRYPRAWGWHLHGIALTRDPAALTKRLAKAFPKTDAVPRPVRVTPWDGSPRWLRYCHKLEGRCRVGVDDEPHFEARKKEPRKCRDTKPRSLTSNERLELLLFHDNISLDSRILTKGAQLRSSKKGCSIVRLRRPKR
jgi:hypothetical protein